MLQPRHVAKIAAGFDAKPAGDETRPAVCVIHITAARRHSAYIPVTTGAGMIPARDKQANDVIDFNNEVRELAIDELDAVAGGSWLDVVVEAVETVAHIVTGNTGVFK